MPQNVPFLRSRFWGICQNHAMAGESRKRKSITLYIYVRKVKVLGAFLRIPEILFAALKKHGGKTSRGQGRGQGFFR
jgi:hypothetical protein